VKTGDAPWVEPDLVHGRQRLAFSTPGDLLAVASRRSWHIQVFDVAAGTLRVEFSFHDGGIACLEFYSWWGGSGRISSGGHNARLMTWDVASTPAGAFVAPENAQNAIAHTGSVTALAHSWDGRLLASGGADGVVKLWDPRPGIDGFFGLLRANLTGRKELLHSGPVSAIAFSGDSRRLITAGGVSGRHAEIKLWTSEPRD